MKVAIVIELPECTCVRCGKVSACPAYEIRRDDPADPTRWQVRSWQSLPDGWRRWATEVIACGDCADVVEAQHKQFVESLKRA